MQTVFIQDQRLRKQERLALERSLESIEFSVSPVPSGCRHWGVPETTMKHLKCCWNLALETRAIVCVTQNYNCEVYRNKKTVTPNTAAHSHIFPFIALSTCPFIVLSVSPIWQTNSSGC